MFFSRRNNDNPIRIFIFDFDLTVSRQHIYNILSDRFNPYCSYYRGKGLDKERNIQWDECVKNVLPRGTKERWKAAIEKIIDSGNFVGIATFNSYDYIVKRFFRETIGISEKHLKKMIFKCKKVESKVTHVDSILADIVSDTKKALSYGDVTYVDDTKNETAAVKAKGAYVIEATPAENEDAPPFLTQLEERINQVIPQVEQASARQCVIS